MCPSVCLLRLRLRPAALARLACCNLSVIHVNSEFQQGCQQRSHACHEATAAQWRRQRRGHQLQRGYYLALLWIAPPSITPQGTRLRRLCAIALAGAVNLLDTSRSSMNKPSGQPRVCHLLSLFPASLSFSLTQSHIQSVSRCDLATFQSPAVNVCVIIPAICCSANCSCIPTIRYCLCAFPLALSRLHLLFTPLCISLTLSHSHSLFCVPIFTAFWRFLLSMEKEFGCSTSTLLV